jgi:hypothetical protein
MDLHRRAGERLAPARGHGACREYHEAIPALSPEHVISTYKIAVRAGSPRKDSFNRKLMRPMMFFAGAASA